MSVGEPLANALKELERSGLRLVYSSVLVTPDLRVLAKPTRAAPERVARELLAQHGLALVPIRAGQFAIVRAAKPAVDAAAATPSAGDTEFAPSEVLEEIAVYASRYRVRPQPAAGAAELEREDIEALPGIDQDVLRVTKYLPGTATNGVSSRPYVRGGRQNELAVYFDGIPLFEPFHFKDFQGLLGVLDPAVVGSMDFYSGVLPVRFGDRLSGALDIVPRATDGDDTWIFGISPLYVSAVTSGSYDARKVDWLAAARTSTLSLVLDQLETDIGDPEFTDVLARVTLPVGEHGRVTAGWMLLDDALKFHDNDFEEIADASYRDVTGWLRGEYQLAERWDLTAALSHTERHTTRRGSIARASATGSADDQRRHDASTARFEVTRRGQHSQVVAGIEAQHYVSHYRYRGQSHFDPRLAAAFGRPAEFNYARSLDATGDAYSAYLLDAWQPLRGLTLSAGARFDAQRYAGFDHDQLSPRVLLDYAPGERWHLRAAIGRMHQSERPDELQIQDGEEIFHRAQRAEQAVLSLEHGLGRDWWLRVESFDKRIKNPLPIYENLLDTLVPLPELEVDRFRVAPLESRIYGVESTLRWQPPQRWAGWLSYTWTEAKDNFGGYTVSRTWDQRHAANAGISWTRRPWQLSGTAQWRSGWRRNELSLLDQTTGEVALAPRNSLAYPDMFSIDLRATWTWALRASALHFYVDMGNATNHQTPCCTSYDLIDNGGSWALERDYDISLPRYVLFGVNWEIR